jgi:hypothetical protein
MKTNSRYSDRIMEVAECDLRDALVLENAMRWEAGTGFNPGTLDHLSASEFDTMVRATKAAFSARPDLKAEMVREAEAEGLIPAAAGA